MKSNLIIAGDDLNCSKKIYNTIKMKNLDVEVIGITTDGEETLKMIENANPNILILDLKMSKRNGLNVLNEIKENKNIKIIITSGEVQMINKINSANYSMIKNIFIKPFDYEILCSSIDRICANSNKRNSENIIDETLHEFCFNFSSLFYQYLIKCIEKETVYNITLKQLYNEVAKDSNIDSNKIKWGIEKLISSMVRYTPREKINNFFPYTNRPSTKTFIVTIAEIIKKKRQE